MGAYICYMSIRLIAMRRLLKPTGSIYLHCDHSASHYLKAAMDAIFKRGMFINEITWQRTQNPKGTKRNFPKNTDRILVYAKSKNYTWNVQHYPITGEQRALYDKHCPRTGRLMRLASLTGHSGAHRPNLVYEVMGVTRSWSCSKERMNELINQGLIIQTAPGNVPRRVLYLDEAKGKRIDNNWTDIEALHSKSVERYTYPTQKPLLLYERMIKTSSNEEDLVLDPFCGCATAVLAAEKLKRSWIGIDIWYKAKQAVIDRLASLDILQEHEINKGLLDRKVIFTNQIPTKQEKSRGNKKSPSNKEMKNILIKEHGLICQGCNHEFPTPEHFELDHIRPKKDKGGNELENRTLLCGPCNRKKGHKLTLSGLQDLNKKEGRWFHRTPLS